MTRIYRALLRLYPSSYRAEYAESLASAFDERVRTSRVSMVEAVADVVGNAAAVHFDILRQDFRYTMRSLRRARDFALTTILVVALGVGATTAAFSLASFVLIRPLPYPASDRLVDLWNGSDEHERNEASPALYREPCRHSHAGRTRLTTLIS